MLCLAHFFLYIKNFFLHIFWGYFMKYEFRIIIIFSWELKVLFRNTFIDLFVGGDHSHFKFFFDNVLISSPFLKDTFSGCTILRSSHFSTLRMISIIFLPLFYVWIPWWILRSAVHAIAKSQTRPSDWTAATMVDPADKEEVHNSPLFPAVPTPARPRLRLLTYT